MTRREWLLSSVGCIAVAAAYVVLATTHSALDVARTDDWSFLRVAQGLAATGEVSLTGWVQMFFLGQLALTVPLVAVGATSIAALHLFVALLAAGTLWLSYTLARRFLSWRLALLAVVLLAIGPLFGTLAVTYLSDVPAMFLTLASLLVGAVALEQASARQRWLLFLSLGLAVWAFTVREYGALAAVAVLGALVFGTRRGTRAWWGAWLALGAVGLTCMGLLRWRSAMPGSTPTSVRVNDLVETTLPTVVLVGLALALFTLPAIAASSPVRALRGASRGAHVASVAWGVAVVAGLALVRWRFPLGDFLTVYGSYPGTVVGGLDEVLLSRGAVILLAAAAGLGLLLVGPVLVTTPGSVLRSAPPSVRVVGLFVALMLLLLLVMSAALPVVFDRYLVVLVPLIAALVLWVGRERGILLTHAWRAIPATALVGLAAVGLVVVDHAAAVDAGKWQAAEAAVELGYPASAVDGGFEWFSYHQPGRATWRPDLGGEQWWVTLFDDTQVCAVVVRSPDGRADALADVSTRTILGRTLHFSVLSGPDDCI